MAGIFEWVCTTSTSLLPLPFNDANINSSRSKLNEKYVTYKFWINDADEFVEIFSIVIFSFSFRSKLFFWIYPTLGPADSIVAFFLCSDRWRVITFSFSIRSKLSFGISGPADSIVAFFLCSNRCRVITFSFSFISKLSFGILGPADSIVAFFLCSNCCRVLAFSFSIRSKLLLDFRSGCSIVSLNSLDCAYWE